MSALWSYALAAIGLTGLWLAGSGRAIGWKVGVAAQLLWIAYAVATHQWGFIATALAYAIVYLRGARRAERKMSTLCACCGDGAVSWASTYDWGPGGEAVVIPSCGKHITRTDYAAFLLSPRHGDRIEEIVTYGLRRHLP